jgi:hypothetical protein
MAICQASGIEPSSLTFEVNWRGCFERYIKGWNANGMPESFGNATWGSLTDFDARLLQSSGAYTYWTENKVHQGMLELAAAEAEHLLGQGEPLASGRTMVRTLAKTKDRTNVKMDDVAEAGKHMFAVRVFQRTLKDVATASSVAELYTFSASKDYGDDNVASVSNDHLRSATAALFQIWAALGKIAHQTSDSVVQTLVKAGADFDSWYIAVSNRPERPRGSWCLISCDTALTCAVPTRVQFSRGQDSIKGDFTVVSPPRTDASLHLVRREFRRYTRAN